MEKPGGPLAALRELLYKNWDRIATNLSLLLSLISIIITFYLVKVPQDIPRFITVRDVVLVLVLFLIIAVLAVQNHRRDLIIREKIRQIEHQQQQLAEQQPKFVEMREYLSNAFK